MCFSLFLVLNRSTLDQLYDGGGWRMGEGGVHPLLRGCTGCSLKFGHLFNV